jgi:hypothetical protein
MRLLEYVLAPMLGCATCAGFDVVEQPLEVKKRISKLYFMSEAGYVVLGGLASMITEIEVLSTKWGTGEYKVINVAAGKDDE